MKEKAEQLAASALEEEKSHTLNQFTMPQEALLYEAFAALIQKKINRPLNNAYVESQLNRMEGGNSILKKFDVVKIINKVKYYKKRERLGKNNEIKKNIETHESQAIH